MILNLGVINVPYSGKESITTVEVAQILEEEYGVMQIFADMHLDNIAKSLEESVAGALDNVMMGREISNPFGDAEAEIEELFKFTYLEGGEAEGVAPNTPTQASIDRMSSRFKSGRSTGVRPSFIETSNYENSFKAWVDE